MQWDTEYALRTLPHTATLDIPAFLENCKDAILVTGGLQFVSIGRCSYPTVLFLAPGMVAASL